MTGLDDWLFATVRYFGACPVCGRRERGGELTYATLAETAAGDDTGCCSTDPELLPPVLLVAAVYVSPTALRRLPPAQPAWWLRDAAGKRRF